MSSQMPCLEVAVSTAEEPTVFEPLQKQTHRELMTLQGFIHGIALRSLDNPASRADLILWDSKESAKSAAEVIQHDNRFSAFMQGIESVRHFAHYSGASLTAMQHLVKSPIIEIAAYVAVPNNEISQLRPKIHTALRAINGASPQISGVHTANPSALLDVIGWDDKATHQAAPRLLMERHPDVKPFFSGMGKMDVSELFEVVV